MLYYLLGDTNPSKKVHKVNSRSLFLIVNNHVSVVTKVINEFHF